MSRKIVVAPTFASSHFLNWWIVNMKATLEPDVISMCEGLFPAGPENKGHVDTDEFKSKYCRPLHNNAGFDYDESVRIVKLINVDYEVFPDNVKTTVNINLMSYEGTTDANECFKLAISRWIEPEVGDLIFCLEPDLFLRENQSELILDECEKLKIGEGLQIEWVDFLETQFYTEKINQFQPKWRRFCYRFDNMENYLDAMGSGFMSQNYPKLKKCDKFIGFHYPWFVYGKWKELRYDLIWRSNPKYWEDFEIGLQSIRKHSNHYLKEREYYIDNFNRWTTYGHLKPEPDIIIRPSRQDEGRWAQFIDIEHPQAIQKHPNFVK